MRAGARGYVLKDAEQDDLFRATPGASTLTKLQVADRAQAILRARDAGLS